MGEGVLISDIPFNIGWPLAGFGGPQSKCHKSRLSGRSWNLNGK